MKKDLVVVLAVVLLGLIFGAYGGKAVDYVVSFEYQADDRERSFARIWELPNGHFGGLQRSFQHGCSYAELNRDKKNEFLMVKVLKGRNGVIVPSVQGVDAKRTMDGGLVIVGKLNLTGQQTAIVQKFDSKLDFEWDYLFEPRGEYFVPTVVNVLSDGSIVVIESGIFKLDSKGNLKWWKFFPDWNTPGYEGGGVVEVEDLNTVVTINDSESRGRTVLYKLDPLGNLIWKKALAMGCEQDESLRPQLGSDGNYLIGCTTTGSNIRGSYMNVRAHKISPKGELLWRKTVIAGGLQLGQSFWRNGRDILVSIVAEGDGGVVLAVFSQSGFSQDKTAPPVVRDYGNGPQRGHLWLIKLNSEGDIVWDLSYGVWTKHFHFSRTRRGYLISNDNEYTREVVVDYPRDLPPSEFISGDVVRLYSTSKEKFLRHSTHQSGVFADGEEHSSGTQYLVEMLQDQKHTWMLLRSILTGAFAELERPPFSSEKFLRISLDRESAEFYRRAQFRLLKLGSKSVAVQSREIRFGYLRPIGGDQIQADPSKASDRKMRMSLVSSAQSLLKRRVLIRFDIKNRMMKSSMDRTMAAGTRMALPESSMTFRFIPVNESSIDPPRDGLVRIRSELTKKFLRVKGSEGSLMEATGKKPDNDQVFEVSISRDGYVTLTSILPGYGCLRISKSSKIIANGKTGSSACKVLISSASS